MIETIVLGGGCFWCTEAVYVRVKGVLDVESGYCNGQTVQPTYEEVCSGRTGHNEVVKLQYDPAQVSTRELLEIFFVIHDPTTLNRQGNDRGTQYRSVIFCHTPDQQVEAEAFIAELTASKVYSDTIVTSLEPAQQFWPAEAYHQDYLANNPNQSYCRFVVAPKLAKFRKTFAAKRKTA